MGRMWNMRMSQPMLGHQMGTMDHKMSFHPTRVDPSDLRCASTTKGRSAELMESFCRTDPLSCPGSNLPTSAPGSA